MNLTDRITDLLTQDDLILSRALAAQVRQVQRDVDELREIVSATISRINPTEPARVSDQRRRVEAATRQIDKNIATEYQRLSQQHVVESRSLTATIPERTTEGLNSSLGVALFLPWLHGKNKTTKTRMTSGVVENALIPNEAKGVDLRGRWRSSADSLKAAIRDVLSAAVQRGRRLGDIIEIVRGSASVRFQDGLFHPAKIGLERLLKTAHTQYIQAARTETWRRNSAFVRGVQSIAVLDNRTSVLCRVRNGKAWTLAGEPMDGTDAAYPGPPPWHYHCRSSFIPIVRTLQSVRRGMNKNQHGPLAGLNAQFPLDGNLAETIGLTGWIARSERQGIDVGALVGRARLKLFKAGQITPAQLISQQGRERTLLELTTLQSH